MRPHLLGHEARAASRRQMSHLTPSARRAAYCPLPFSAPSPRRHGLGATSLDASLTASSPKGGAVALTACRVRGRSDNYTVGLVMPVIVDRLQLPASLLPGEYTLGFRWDCESSAQVWQSCADITITA